MKIEIKSLTQEALEQHDWKDIFTILIDGESSFYVSDGEPEDANLSRDFNDCLKIPTLLEKAYEAGKRGEQIEVTHSRVSLDEIQGY